MVRAVWVVVASVVLALGCGKQKAGSGKPKVAVSIFPLYDVTRRVAGDRADVVLVLPPGKSEHGYDPAPKEIARLDGAKLGFTVGLDMDGWAENILRTAGDARIVRLGDKVKPLPISLEPISDADAREHAGGHEEQAVGAPDPHFWLDPERMLGVIDQIAAELAAVDPTGTEAFAANARTLEAQLTDLDGTIAARSKRWSRHTIVTFHGSMSYFANRYGVRIAAVVEPIAGKEPTAAYIARVLEAIKRSQAVALFTEPQLDKRPGEVIAHEAGIPLGELDPIGGVAGRDSYEKLLLWNTDQLEKVLE